jgi:hypothetical protein
MPAGCFPCRPEEAPRIQAADRYRVIRVVEGRNIADSWSDFFQDFKTLAAEVCPERINTGESAFGPGEAVNETYVDRVAPSDEHDGGSGRGSFGGKTDRGPKRKDEIDPFLFKIFRRILSRL